MRIESRENANDDKCIHTLDGCLLCMCVYVSCVQLRRLPVYVGKAEHLVETMKLMRGRVDAATKRVRAMGIHIEGDDDATRGSDAGVVK